MNNKHIGSTLESLFEELGETDEVIELRRRKEALAKDLEALRVRVEKAKPRSRHRVVDNLSIAELISNRNDRARQVLESFPIDPEHERIVDALMAERSKSRARRPIERRGSTLPPPDWKPSEEDLQNMEDAPVLDLDAHLSTDPATAQAALDWLDGVNGSHGRRTPSGS